MYKTKCAKCGKPMFFVNPPETEPVCHSCDVAILLGMWAEFYNMPVPTAHAREMDAEGISLLMEVEAAQISAMA